MKPGVRWVNLFTLSRLFDPMTQCDLVLNPRVAHNDVWKEVFSVLCSSGAAARHSHSVCHSLRSLLYPTSAVTSALWIPGGVKPSQSKNCRRITPILIYLWCCTEWWQRNTSFCCPRLQSIEQRAGSALGWKQSCWMIQWCWRTSEQRWCCCQALTSPGVQLQTGLVSFYSICESKHFFWRQNFTSGWN